MIIFLWFFSDAIFSPFLNKERGIEYTTTLMSLHLFVYTVSGLFQTILEWTTKMQVLVCIIIIETIQLIYMLNYDRSLIYFSTPLFFIQIILNKRYIIIMAKGEMIDKYLIINEKQISLGLSSGYLLSIFINQWEYYNLVGYTTIVVSILYTVYVTFISGLFKKL